MLKTLGRMIGDFVKKADMLLLLLCTVATIFGIVMISSATNNEGSASYVRIQTIALLLGILVYIVLTMIDVDIIAERRELLLIFCFLFIGSLYFFGIEADTGNKSWIEIPLLPMNAQPAEICKIFFIIVLAKMMNIYQNKLSTPLNMIKLFGITMLFFVLIIVVSRDMGVALIYVFIFLTMTYVGGVNMLWYVAGFGALAVAAPVLWTNIMREDQKNRILALFDPSIDPSGQGVLWQTNLSQKYIQSGGLAGQGLYNGPMVQGHAMPGQHTDFIFSSIAEELGMLGCVVVLLLLTGIVIRCIYVGVKSGNYMNRCICIGIAGMLVFQIIVNVGVCLGVVPVIGLTLPFISYGGSSIVTMFMCMGVVSGIHMRPAPDANARYIRPK